MGNGGSAAEVDHTVSEFVTHGIRAVSLCNPATITALANDYKYSEVFSRQVKVMCKFGDILIGFTTSGKSKNIIRAYEQAKKQLVEVIDWPRKGKDTAEIQEYQLRLMHRVYKKVSEQLQPKEESTSPQPPKKQVQPSTHGSDSKSKKLQRNSRLPQAMRCPNCKQTMVSVLILGVQWLECQNCSYFRLVSIQSESSKPIAGKKRVSHKHKT